MIERCDGCLDEARHAIGGGMWLCFACWLAALGFRSRGHDIFPTRDRAHLVSVVR